MKVYRLMEDHKGLLMLEERVFFFFWKSNLRTYLPKVMRDYITFLELELDDKTGYWIKS